MKIAITTLSGVGYGGATYFRNLIPTLAKVDKINEYHIFIQKNNPLINFIHQNNFFFYECIQNNDSALIRLLWEQIIFPRELKKRKIDIVFTAKNANILFAPCKTIISIQNMEPFCYRQYKNHWKLNIFSWLRAQLTKVSMKKAHRIIAPTKFVKKYLEERFPKLTNKIDVVYNGNPVRNYIRESTEFAKPTHFLLSASKFIAYANQFNLLQGYSRLYQEDDNIPPLWLAGGIHDKLYFEKIKKFIKEKHIEEKVKILGLISHERLVQLYASALVFLFPSTLETFSQILVEAMACGVPIAASNVPPIPEVCKDAAIYFNPYDPKDISEKIRLLLSDGVLRENLKKASLERCKFFDWDKIAIEIVKLFEKVYADKLT